MSIFCGRIVVVKADNMAKSTTKDKVLTGAAGEYYVAFQLAASEYAVGLTTRGTRLIDIFVANPKTGKSITIQTKTMRKASVRSKRWGLCWN